MLRKNTVITLELWGRKMGIHPMFAIAIECQIKLHVGNFEIHVLVWEGCGILHQIFQSFTPSICQTRTCTPLVLFETKRDYMDYL